MQPQSIFRALALCTIAILMFSTANTISVIPAETQNPCSGPYLDKIKYTEIVNSNDRIIALLSGDADALHNPVSATDLSSLALDSDINIHSMTDNGQRYIDINCIKYPLNISGFRRAFAYAFNKSQVVSEVLGGHGIVHDSVVSIKEELCIEDELPWNYYSDRSDLGNQILDDLNFVPDGVTGWRNAPDGTPFTVDVAYIQLDLISQGIAEKAADALRSMYINADTYPDMGSVRNNVYEHGDYDMYVYKDHYYERTLDWILDNYYSQTSTTWYMNPSNYENDTFDTLRTDVLNAPTELEFLEAVSAIQTHLHENVPVLIVSHDIEYQAYRNTHFAGQVEDEFWGIPGPWTNVKVHNKVGNAFGGVFDYAMSNYPYTFNMFLAVADWNENILRNLYSGIYKMGPDGEVYLDLAEEVHIETHSTNIAVPEGQTWVTMIVKDGIVWSDGTPLTGGDVAFTFTYLYETGLLGNPSGDARWTDDFLLSEVPSPSYARVKLNKDSYYMSLVIQQMLLTKIIPEHVFNEETGIGYAGWSTWNPVFTSDPFVTCGPFYLSAHDSTTFELSRNLDYHWPSGLAPKVLSSDDVTYVQGTTGNQIVWEVTDEDPNDFTIYRDGSLVVTDDWNGSDIIHNVDGLSVGSYNYTLVLTDISGHIVTDTVWVTVSSSGGLELPDMLTMGIIAGSSIVIIVAVVLIYKKR